MAECLYCVVERLELYRDLKRLREIQSSFYIDVMRYMLMLEALGVSYFSQINLRSTGVGDLHVVYEAVGIHISLVTEAQPAILHHFWLAHLQVEHRLALECWVYAHTLFLGKDASATTWPSFIPAPTFELCG